MNWVVPGKFISFSGPLDDLEIPNEYTAEDYVPVFKEKGVSLVIRLNKPKYDKTKFTEAGIKHLDLYFRDGSIPR